jgi:hypothetical protein
MVKGVNMLKAVKTKLQNSGAEGLSNQGEVKTEIVQFETPFDLDQAQNTLSTDNVTFPGTPGDIYIIEGMRVKPSEAFAFDTISAKICLVAAGGTASTGSIAVHTFTETGGAVGNEVSGTYSATDTQADPKLKVKGGTMYEVGIYTRPTDASACTGQIKILKIDYRRERSYDAD